MFVKFGEIPTMTLQDIKETKRNRRTHGRTHERTDGQRENSIPTTNKVCGGIIISHYDETNKRAHDSQIVRAKEKLKVSYSGPSKNKHQTPTNKLKLYARAVIESEAWQTTVQLKRKP